MGIDVFHHKYRPCCCGRTIMEEPDPSGKEHYFPALEIGYLSGGCLTESGKAAIWNKDSGFISWHYYSSKDDVLRFLEHVKPEFKAMFSEDFILPWEDGKSVFRVSY